MLRSESVEQMIQILVRFRDKYSRSYNIDEAHKEAVDDVTERWQLSSCNTIRDLCSRRLGLSSISKFRNLLEKWMLGEPKPLFELLKIFTPLRFHTEIEAVLVEGKGIALKRGANLSSVNVAQRFDENFSFSIDPQTAKELKVLSVMEGISTSDWLKNTVAILVNREYKVWLDLQKNNSNKGVR